MKKIYFFTLFLLPFLGQASEFNLTEQKVLELGKKSNPTLSQIEQNALRSSLNSKMSQDQFGFELYGGVNHQSTKEKGLIPFQPVFGSVNQYKVGVKKYTKYGAVIDLNTSVDTRSSNSGSANYKDLTTTTYALDVSFDLWKDLLGKISKAKLSNLEDIKKKDELQKTISIKQFENNIRKLYWQFVAVEEKVKITKGLYQAAQKQSKNARQRRASSISDTAEVARFESLVHQRKGQLIYLEYQREMLIKNLRDLFPELIGQKVILKNYSLSDVASDVLKCSVRISNTNSVPYEFTSYDEVTSLLAGVQKRQLRVDQAYDDIDLKLNLGIQKVGVGSEAVNDSDYIGDYETSLDDMNNNDRSGFKAGLTFSIPFGEGRSDTAKIQELLTEKEFTSQLQNLDTNVISTHEQIKKSMSLLTQVIQEQKSNSKSLALRVKEMQKKYKQARIPEYALIQDEDSLLQSDLAVVDTQLLIVTTVLDYFSIFDTYPCAFNRK